MNRLLYFDQAPLLPMNSSSSSHLPAISIQHAQNSYSAATDLSCICLDRRKKLQNVIIAFLIIGLLVFLTYSVTPTTLLISVPIRSSSAAAAGGIGDDDQHYSVVIDAGSSGSRAYLYFWPSHSGEPHELLKIGPLKDADGNPRNKKVSPGLSSFQDSPEEALSHIKPLLDFALDHIPAAQVHETPLFILATAGMRMVERSKQETLVRHLREGIASNYGFLFPEGNLEVISGKQEGIYQWLAINYVLGKFRHHEQRSEMVALDERKEEGRADAGDNLVLRAPTVGAIDMGGASMQIAMEVTTQLQMQGMSEQEKSLVAEINIGCKDHDPEHTYRIYVTTFLGYGANEALARHRRDLILSQIERNEVSLIGSSSSNRILDPCLPLDYAEDASVNFVSGKYNTSSMSPAQMRQLEETRLVFLKGTGEWEKCYKMLKDFTRSRERFGQCGGGAEGGGGGGELGGCHDEGIKVPLIQFERSEFYGFSEFWYSMEDVLRMGGPYIYSQYQPVAKSFCEIPWDTTWKKYQDGHYPKADRERIQTQCFKSAWLTVALHEGLGFPTGYSHLSAAPESVNGDVVHWTLGALLYRTRFIPLREIESRAREQVHHGPYHSAWASGYLFSNYVILICLILVIGAIVLYLQRLKRYVRPSTLRKVPSLNFWIPSPDLLLSRSPSQERAEPLLSVVSSNGDYGRKLFSM